MQKESTKVIQTTIEISEIYGIITLALKLFAGIAQSVEQSSRKR